MCVKEILRVFPPEDCHGGGLEKIPWRRDRLPTPEFLGFPCGSAGKESTCSMGDLGLIPGLGRSPGEGNSHPLQYTAWRIPWTVWSRGHKESDTTEQLSHSLYSVLNIDTAKRFMRIISKLLNT